MVGNSGAVKVLMEHGADPNRPSIGTENDVTAPCFVAASGGHLACIRALVEGAARQGRKLDVNVQSKRGSGLTPLDIAIGMNTNLKVVSVSIFNCFMNLFLIHRQDSMVTWASFKRGAHCHCSF